MKNKVGIVERAKAAPSLEVLRSIEAEAKGYDFISAQTLARLRRAVIKRGKELKDAGSN